MTTHLYQVPNSSGIQTTFTNVTVPAKKIVHRAIAEFNAVNTLTLQDLREFMVSVEFFREDSAVQLLGGMVRVVEEQE